MQDLKLKTTLPALSFDYEGLKAWAKGLTEKYSDLVVTEDAVIATKTEMADLNKAKKALDDARKETVRQISAPIANFEKQIKEICGIFDTTYTFLGDQVKKFEDRQREDNRAEVQKLITELLTGCGLEIAIPIQDKWLNKATSMKSIREDIQAIISRETENIRLRNQAEQAKQERAGAIEQAVKAANARHGLELGVAQFMTARNLALETSWDSVVDEIDRVVVDQLRAKTAQEQATLIPEVVPESSPAATPHPMPKPVGIAPVLTREETVLPVPAVETVAVQIMLTYDKADDATVRAHIEALRVASVTFSARRL